MNITGNNTSLTLNFHTLLHSPKRNIFNYLTDIKLLTKLEIFKARYSLTVLEVPLNPNLINQSCCIPNSVCSVSWIWVILRVYRTVLPWVELFWDSSRNKDVIICMHFWGHQRWFSLVNYCAIVKDYVLKYLHSYKNVW